MVTDGADRPDEANAPAEPPLTTTAIQAISRRNWTRGLILFALAFVVLVGLGWGAASIYERLHQPAALAAIDEIRAASDGDEATVETTAGGVATAHWSASVGKAVIVAPSLPELDDEEIYQAWLEREGTPIDAGTFAAAADGATAFLLDAAYREGDRIQVTIEAAGGAAEPDGELLIDIPTE